MTSPPRTLLNTSLKAAAWLTLAGVAWATLGPIGFRPQLFPGYGDLDRVLGYAALSFMFTWAYPQRFFAVASVVILGAAALEAFQLLTVDRHGDVSHLVVKLAGAAVGLQAGLWSRRLLAPAEA